MKKSVFKVILIRFVLRPVRDIKLSLYHVYSRVLLFLALCGVSIPGLEKIKQRLNANAKAAYERRALVYQIKGERYHLRTGPLWFRHISEKAILLFSQNRFWFFIILKTLAAFLVIALPVSIFLLIRGVLPVPERVPYTIPSAQPLKRQSSLRTDWPYTEGPFQENPDHKPASPVAFIDPNATRGVSLTPVLEPHSPAGLTHFGIGDYPAQVNLIRGFLLGSKAPLVINRQKNIELTQRNENKLRVQFYLFPTPNGTQHLCQLELKDEQGHVLGQITETTQTKSWKLPRLHSIAEAWQNLFVPEATKNLDNIKELIIPIERVPKTILATAKNLSPVTADTAVVNAQNTDVTFDPCVFALGDFSVEHPSATPLKRRGIVFILVDTLRADTAYDKETMPHLNQFFASQGIRFLEHRAQGNMTVPSVSSFMTSLYPREIGPIAFTYSADRQERKNFYDREIPLLATTLQELGYRVGGIGWLSLFTEALQGGVDLGFHNAIISENPAYEARQITEHMGEWLKDYGNAPFFLYLHYNTMHGPYKPPFSEIDLAKLLKNPLGIKQKRELYEALGRYWDSEFINILQKLKDLGLDKDVDIIVTADHGAQLNTQPWEYWMGVSQHTRGGYADKGHTLFDEEVRVPFFLHLADRSFAGKTTVTLPTAHADLFPTLYHLAGGKTAHPAWKGLDLSPALQTTHPIPFAEVLNRRNEIYFDGHKYAGILYWGKEFAHSPTKYIRQFADDDVELYLEHPPWQKHITWRQAELYSTVNFTQHTESWQPTLPGASLRTLRSVYLNTSPSEKSLKITAKYSGELSFKVTLALRSQAAEQTKRLRRIPKGMTLQTQKIKNSHDQETLTLFLTGHVAANDPVEILLTNATITDVAFTDNVKAIMCSASVDIQNKFLANILENDGCAFSPPPDEVISLNFSAKDKPVVVQKSLPSEEAEEQQGKGAGTVLQNALRDWGYAK